MKSMIDGRAVSIGCSVSLGYMALTRASGTDARAILFGFALIFGLLALLFHELNKWGRM